MLRKIKKKEILTVMIFAVAIVHDYWTTNTLHVPSIVFLIVGLLYVIDLIKGNNLPPHDQ